MKLAIKNPAPLSGGLTRWGDYHFGMSLQHALESRGVEVVQHFWPEWDRDDGEDMVLVLRGKRRLHRVPEKQAALWIISHPGSVSPEELDEFDLVFSASETFTRIIGTATSTPMEVMRQCTDTRMFHGGDPEGGDADRHGIVFVANSRGVRREILGWAQETGMLPALIGSQWEQLGLGHLVTQEFIENTELPDLYRGARLALNDHWGDMRYFGIISNRIFDCLACGLPVVTDGFPELVEICGEGVHVAHDARSYWDAVWKHRTRYPEIMEGAKRTWARIGADHTFDARADQIIAHFGAPAARKRRATAASGAQAPRVAWMEDVLRQVAQKRASKSEVMRVLHLCPSIEGSAYLAGLGYVHSLTAGPGEGPWQLPLTPALADMFSGSFDAVIVEREDLWRQVADPAAVLAAIEPSVATHGAVAIAPHRELFWQQPEDDNP